MRYFLKYILVGLVNTGITFIVILILTLSNINLFISNFIGYALGIAVSFILNSIFTFEKTIAFSNAARFLGVSLICYGANLAVLFVSSSILLIQPIICQVIGMIFYTVCGYVLNKKFTFK